FKKIGYYKGVSKCDDLTKHITDCLNTLRKANIYYTKAVEYYKEAESKNATRYVEIARAKYLTVNYRKGVRKCNTLKNNISEMSKKKEEGDKLLSEARTYYSEKRYRDSNKKAEEAKKIYEEIGYKKGITRTKAWIRKNNGRIDNIDAEARETMVITVGVILGAIVVTIAIWGVRKTQEKRMADSRMSSERQRLEEELRHRKEEVKKRERERIHELEIEREKLKAMVEGEKKRLETGEK
ncbi:MAG: hypothetical protein U9Q22_05535, partial [Candidatus Altiarchaeota archaeon]|nr:hypothetical protein [Candidatus Altiarchaeota archaeon]